MSNVESNRARKRRLLVISYHFPPDGTIGGQRWAGLSKYLARLGWDVHVVTASAPNEHRMPEGVHRHYCARRSTLNDFYRARFARNADQALQRVEVSSRPQREPNNLVRLLAGVRRLAGSSMVLPDHGRGWVSRATKMARSLMADGDFDCIISSGPPHSAHFAGWFARVGSKADFYIDMRDPWALTHEMNTPEDAFIRIEKRCLAVLERAVFPRATKVLVNTREFATALRQSQPDLDVVCFPNGIDAENLPERDAATVKTGTIAYVGTLYAGRNLSSLFSAMSSMIREGIPGASDIRVNVAGPLESPHKELMHAEIDSGGLASNVSVLGTLPRNAALKLLGSAHLALVLAQDQPMCVPAKLYESVGLGVPTLVIAERNSAAACEARRIGAMTVEGDDIDGMKTLLSDMLRGAIPISIEAKAPISYEELAKDMERLLLRGVRNGQGQTEAARQTLPQPV
jgi:glycosyltransferase involved in cell wall biosynthesis